MSDLLFKVSGTSESGARIRVAARGFSLVVDEPAALGGTDEGANPVEFVLTGFVGCLNVVAHLVARELGFEIRALGIDAAGSLNPMRLLNHPTSDRAGFKEIGVKLSVDADADADTLARWIAIIESRCPVADNLGNATPVRVEYAATAQP
jgi:uncharacterized OsmC-like protein